MLFNKQQPRTPLSEEGCDCESWRCLKACLHSAAEDI